MKKSNKTKIIKDIYFDIYRCNECCKSKEHNGKFCEIRFSLGEHDEPDQCIINSSGPDSKWRKVKL
jgi:hypothetical protein